jgi:hypothetical protein
MAAPNILSATSIYGKTVGRALDTTLTTGVLTCAANKVLKINSIIVSNIDGSSAADVTASFYDSTAATSYQIASTVSVPADSTLIVLGKDSPIYLEESDEIRAGASANGDLVMIVSYDELDDA